MRSPEPTRRAALLGGAGAILGAVTGCTRDPAPELTRIVVATGPPGAVYREIGGALARLLDEHLPNQEVVTMETGASHDNLILLESADADLGLANLDSILATDVTAQGSATSAVGRLYDSFVHLVVPADSPVRRLIDIEGLRVSVGEINSGTEFTAEQLIDVTGVRHQEVRLDQADSAAALASGDIDAMFSLTGIPTPAIADLAEERPLRLVDLSDTADEMVNAYPEAYFPATIPATTYTGIPACPTMSVPNLLLCRKELPEELVRQITEALYTGAPRLAEQRPEAAQINVRTGISTGVVPLHPGAESWYRDNKPASEGSGAPEDPPSPEPPAE